MRTYLDSSVLLTAWKRGQNHDKALSIMADEQRQFVTSQIVKLELLPKAKLERRASEVEFYQRHFRDAESHLTLSRELGIEAQALAERHGLAAVDALHLAAAVRLGADEFITSELPGKPLFRVTELKVISLHAL